MHGFAFRMNIDLKPFERISPYPSFKTNGRLAVAVLFLFPALFAPSVSAFEFGNEKFHGALDTTLSYGAIWRVQHQDPELIGIANGGKANTVTGDDGDRNYDTGMVSRAFKATHDLQLDYSYFSTFVRASYFYDFENIDNHKLTDAEQRGAGRDFQFLDAYLQGKFKPWGHGLAIRAGKQVVSWGESTFIQNGINAINPVDVSKLRVPGSELREALLPSKMVWSSLELTHRLNVEGFYLAQWDRIKFDTCGSYFSTSDVACEDGADTITSGFGLAPEGTPSQAVRRLDDRNPPNGGQHGAAIHYLVPHSKNTEVGLYYLKYHSRLPYVSGKSRNPGQAPLYYFEYPKNIHLYGASFNTMLGGIAFQGEYSHRTNMPIAIEGFEVLASAQYAPFSQLGAVNGPGQEVRGYRRYNVGQYQGTLTYAVGPRNPFFANQWTIVAEGAATKVYGMPRPNQLRFEAPGTDLPGGVVAGAPGVQKTGWASSFSWGYVLTTNVTYNQALGEINLSPFVSYAHDVHGTTPSPINNFVEDRRAFTGGLRSDYLNSIFTELSYTIFYGAGRRNVLNDRDFVSANVKYAF